MTIRLWQALGVPEPTDDEIEALMRDIQSGAVSPPDATVAEFRRYQSPSTDGCPGWADTRHRQANALRLASTTATSTRLSRAAMPILTERLGMAHWNVFEEQPTLPHFWKIKKTLPYVHRSRR